MAEPMGEPPMAPPLDAQPAGGGVNIETSPGAVIETSPDGAATHDPFVVRFVVVTIGVLAVMGMIGTFLLLKWEVPEGKLAIWVGMAGAPVGSLGTLLVTTRIMRPAPAG